MNKIFFFILMSLSAFQTIGYSQKQTHDSRRIKSDTIPADSLEYELVITEPGFDQWLATQPPVNFYSNEYYASKNREYVTEWNNRYMNGRRKGLYENYIDYNPNISYPLDLNYKLYYYFRYFEEKNRVRLINSLR